MKRPIVAANFKMNLTASETAGYAARLATAVAGLNDVEVVVAPPFTALDRAARAFGNSAIRLAAQNVHEELRGAFTGEISVPMLADLGCRYAIVGHSERRRLFGETDADVAAKVAAVLAGGLRPIVCVGESLEERQAERTLDVVTAQLLGSLAEVPQERATDVVVAYEPVWAIGTGRTATPDEAQEVHQAIRGILSGRFGEAGRELRIQYGGSVTPQNARGLLALPDIDGALVGGASLDPDDFASIVRAASTTRTP